jgi:hypothetical protein
MVYRSVLTWCIALIAPGRSEVLQPGCRLVGEILKAGERRIYELEDLNPALSYELKVRAAKSVAAFVTAWCS